MTFGKLNRLVAASVLGLTFGTLNLIAQQPTRAGGFHLAMLVQHGDDNPNLLWNTGDPILHLKAEDFWAQQGGSRLQVNFNKFSAERPSSSSRATRLLVVVSPSVSDPQGTLKRVTHALTAVWREGWQTALVLPDGSTTNYAAGPSSIAPAVPAAMSFEQSYLAAVRGLKNFDGATIVLYLTGSTQGDREVKTPEALIESAKDSMAMLYVADGGLPPHGAWTSEPYSPRSYDLDLSIYTRVPAQGEYIGGVKHEVNAQSALRAMRLDLKGRYDLYIAPQPGKEIDPSQPLSIEVKSKSEIRTISEADGIGKDFPLEIERR
jgi:hypothetical protein